jgi:hypothetical protein
MLAACPCLPRVAVRLVALLSGYTRRHTRSGTSRFHSISLAAKFSLMRCSLVFPSWRLHARPSGSADLSSPVHRDPAPETVDKVFKERLGATAHLRSSSSLSIGILFVRLDDFDLHHGRQSWCCCYGVVLTFSIALYVLLISYLVLPLFGIIRSESFCKMFEIIRPILFIMNFFGINNLTKSPYNPKPREY